MSRGGAGDRLRVALRQGLGLLLTLNFLLFWFVPILVQGQAFRLFLQRLLKPVHDAVDRSPAIRRFAGKYVYREPFRVDYFATALFFLLGAALALALVFW